MFYVERHLQRWFNSTSCSNQNLFWQGSHSNFLLSLRLEIPQPPLATNSTVLRSSLSSLFFLTFTQNFLCYVLCLLSLTLFLWTSREGVALLLWSLPLGIWRQQEEFFLNLNIPAAFIFPCHGPLAVLCSSARLTPKPSCTAKPQSRHGT